MLEVKSQDLADKIAILGETRSVQELTMIVCVRSKYRINLPQDVGRCSGKE